MVAESYLVACGSSQSADIRVQMGEAECHTLLFTRWGSRLQYFGHVHYKQPPALSFSKVTGCYRSSSLRRNRGRIGPRVVVTDYDAETYNKACAALYWCG